LSAEYSQNSSKLIPTNINNLLELAITIFKSKFDIEVSLLVDYDIPEFKIDQNSFSKIIRKVLDSFKENGKIDISLKFLLGEHIVIEGKRYQLLELRVKGDSLRDKSDDLEIEIVAAKMNISTHFRDDEITLQIPFIN
ncbi:MAG: hypothetical protein GXO02_01695, partial [Epsilonproteobacteria bacterium]|nr:hypothetical protein [Campylobacterota bacterium]